VAEPEEETRSTRSPEDMARELPLLPRTSVLEKEESRNTNQVTTSDSDSFLRCIKVDQKEVIEMGSSKVR
jgi:hypothetical protein